jgi:hypothetical protein
LWRLLILSNCYCRAKRNERAERCAAEKSGAAQTMDLN